jgi:alpha-L-fucosidase
MDLNSGKYPPEALLYTDIKSYELGAGQRISKETNRLPALTCLPLQDNWFWKTGFPNKPVKDPQKLVSEDLVPLNNAWCNFILNVAPNTDGLIDDNALGALAAIGHLWKNAGPVAPLPANIYPVISPNIAKHQPAQASWSNDMNIMDFGNDDVFWTAWQSNPTVKDPWYEVDFGKERSFNTIVLTESEAHTSRYRLEYCENGVWHTLLTGDQKGRVKIHRFDRVWGDKVQVRLDLFDAPPGVAELGVFDERR